MRTFVRVWYPYFYVEHSDYNRYEFSDANFNDLPIDNFEVIYEQFRSMTNRPDNVLREMDAIRRFIRRQVWFYSCFDFQLAIESFQPVVNVSRLDGGIPNVNDYPLFTILEDSYGIVYRNQEGERLFLKFDKIGKYSDGTLKVMRLQVDNKLKAAMKIFLETRQRTEIKITEIMLLRRVIAMIYDILDFRRTLRCLEILIGKNRQRTLFDHH